VAPRSLTVLLALAALLLVAGCGGDDGGDDPVARVPNEGGVQAKVRAAAQVTAADFPDPQGRSLEELSAEFQLGEEQAVLGTSVFTPGTNRVAFGMVDANQAFVYGKTAVYVAPEKGGAARGPFPAPADVLLTEPRYRSRQAAGEDDLFAAVYAAEVPLSRAGRWVVLAVTDAGGGRRIAAPFRIEVISKRRDPIPDVGEPAPKVQTDTLASAKGNLEAIDTRVPPSRGLHERSFADVVGEKPVALLFATPQLCASRVCGPVVDEALQMQARYGDRVEFIHQEVFVDNEVEKGYREPLRRFGLRTEPWLFVIGRDGRVAARLEGSFGLRAFESALKQGL
jgi:hypothetical protein